MGCNFLNWEKCKDKDLNLAYGRWKWLKNCIRQGFIFHTIYLLVKILLASYVSWLNLNYGITKQKPKMWGVQRWQHLSKLVTNSLTRLIFITFFSSVIVCFILLSLLVENEFSKNTALGKWEISFCLGSSDKNLRKDFTWRNI